MIRKVHFQNYRCLRDVEMTLEPLTVLVGPNSSGKTTVLEGLRAYERTYLQSFDFWQKDTANTLSIVWTHEDGSSRGHVSTPGRDNEFLFGISPHPSESVTQSLILDLKSLRQENTLALEQRLEQNGSNLANVFASLTRHAQTSVAKELCRLVPMFADVDTLPTQRGVHRLRFQDRWNPTLWLESNHVSDGTMLLLAFIVLQHQTPPVEIITIEEPERALHPYLLDELIQMLRKMTTGEIGQKPVQIVLATHSAELLDYVRPEEVRFLTRAREDGSVQVQQTPPETPHWRRVYEEYSQSLGGIWLSGGLGGVPGA